MNGLCEAPLCPRLSSEIRYVPLDPSYTACLCKECYENELDYSNSLEREGAPRLLPQKGFEEHELMYDMEVLSWV